VASHGRLRPLRAARLASPQPLRTAKSKGGTSGWGGKSSAGGGFRLAAAALPRPVTLRLIASRAPPPSVVAKQFKAAMRLTKRLQRLIRQTEALQRQAEAATPRRAMKPTRPLHSSRADLWRWYRARGLSWARFVADHGAP
jgi:hypothetical protein